MRCASPQNSSHSSMTSPSASRIAGVYCANGTGKYHSRCGCSRASRARACSRTRSRASCGVGPQSHVEAHEELERPERATTFPGRERDGGVATVADERADLPVARREDLVARRVIGCSQSRARRPRTRGSRGPSPRTRGAAARLSRLVGGAEHPGVVHRVTGAREAPAQAVQRRRASRWRVGSRRHVGARCTPSPRRAARAAKRRAAWPHRRPRPPCARAT